MPVRLYFNLNIFFNCKYKCEYKSINNFSFKYICAVRYLKLRFIASLADSPISEIVILKIEMILAFQNKMNVEIIGFEVTHFGFALDLPDVDL